MSCGGGAAVHYGPNNVGGVVNFVTRSIPAKTSQTLRERLTIAEDTGNIFTDTYYRIGGPASDKLDYSFRLISSVVMVFGANRTPRSTISSLMPATI
ncbi:MAG: hypothetical protein MH219_01485 [Marinobacter sp.]|nr:hypothetical protein [Marinobacter sp.]